VIGRSSLLRETFPDEPAVELPQNLALIALDERQGAQPVGMFYGLTADLRARIERASRSARIAYIEAEFFGGHADPQLAMFRMALMPPKASSEAVGILRAGFTEMWKDPQFLADYSRLIKTDPILVSGSEGQEILADLGKVKPEIKEYLINYASKITSR
jgi:hypothetical protein